MRDSSISEHLSKVSGLPVIYTGVLFFTASIGDIVTTWFGYTSGLSEFSPIVRFLIVEFGILSGVIISKVVALLAILLLCFGTDFLNDRTSNDEQININNLLSDLLLIAALIYFGATANNLLVIYVI